MIHVIGNMRRNGPRSFGSATPPQQQSALPTSRSSAPPLFRSSALPTSRSSALLIGFVLITAIQTRSQDVQLPVRHPVYDYLDRIEARYGTDLIQFSRPLSRMEIAESLDSLYRSPSVLSSYDRKQLVYYREEFAEELRRLKKHNVNTEIPSDDRWNLFRINTDTPAGSFLAVDIVGGLAYEKRQNAADGLRRSNGITAYGYADRYVGAYMRWYDNGASGLLTDDRSVRSPEQGIVRQLTSRNPASAEYEIAEGQLLFSLPWLSAGISKTDVRLGSGRGGALALSDHAPSFPRAGFKIRITDWINFEYFHAWLFSDSLDFARTYYPAAGPGAKFFETKYMASHHISARVTPALELTLGESIIYGGGDINPLFLIPVLSFRAADRWTRSTTGNSQFFFDARYRPLPGLLAYGSFFIDEMDFSKVLSGEKTDFDYHIAYTAGLLWADAYSRYIRMASETRLEFTRVYPYVYSNPAPTVQYTSHHTILGHWIGANSDMLLLEHITHPLRGLDIAVNFLYCRFGEQRPEPLVSPRVQPAFLSKPQYYLVRGGLSAGWLPLHDLAFRAHVDWTSVEEKEHFSGSPYRDGLSVGISAFYGIF